MSIKITEIKQEVNKTPQSVTGLPPGQAFFGRVRYPDADRNLYIVSIGTIFCLSKTEETIGHINGNRRNVSIYDYEPVDLEITTRRAKTAPKRPYEG